MLPRSLGPAYKDIAGFLVKSEHEFEIKLHRSSAFVLEGLNQALRPPGSPRVGTGPFRTVSTSDAGIEMLANHDYYLGRPLIEHIFIRQYPSVRSAWAEMLRGQIDMLYDVGPDALESLQPSSAVRVFSFPRNYAYIVLLNVRRHALKEANVRQALSKAVDRKGLLATALRDHGKPADSPVWPVHWAYDPTAPRFEYQPAEAARHFANSRGLRFTCLTLDASPYERLSLALQRQLQAVGVEMDLEPLPIDRLVARMTSGDFDAALLDSILGAMSDQYQFWHSGGTFNHGGFSSRAVDSYLDGIRDSTSDIAYKNGVAGFQRAMVDDPPAIFLAWSERARAVSRRFDVPAEEGRDILYTVRLWHRITDERTASKN